MVQGPVEYQVDNSGDHTYLLTWADKRDMAILAIIYGQNLRARRPCHLYSRARRPGSFRDRYLNCFTNSHTGERHHDVTASTPDLDKSVRAIRETAYMSIDEIRVSLPWDD